MVSGEEADARGRNRGSEVLKKYKLVTPAGKKVKRGRAAMRGTGEEAWPRAQGRKWVES